MAPRLTATLVATAEVGCGALLFLGLFSRFAALVLTFVLCGAFWTDDHAALVGIFKDQDPFFKADPFLFLYASVIVLAFGPGRIALDTLVFRDKKP